MRAHAEIEHGHVQAKLDVGRSDDPAEAEADRVADAVIRRLQAPPSTARRRQGAPQRQIGASLVVRRSTRTARRGGVIGPQGGVLGSATERSLEGSRGGGSALDTATRTRFETAMGADLSGVRIHTDHKADQLSRSMQAQAFTTGRDVFFSAGAYDPSSSAGQHLLAHELAHTVQQGAAPVKRQVADPLTYTRTGETGQRQVRRAMETRKTLTAVAVRAGKGTDRSGGSKLARVKAGQTIKADPTDEVDGYMKAEVPGVPAKTGFVRSSRLYDPQLALGQSNVGLGTTLDPEGDVLDGVDEASGILGMGGMGGDMGGALKDKHGSSDSGDSSFMGKLKGDGGTISDKSMAGHVSNMEVAGGAAGIVNGFMSILAAVKAFKSGDMKPVDKAELAMDMASGVTGTGTGIATTIKEASELTNEGGKALGKSAEAAGFMGSVGEAIGAVKAGFTLIKEIYETWKENKEGTADEGTNAKHGISIVKSGLELAAGVVKTMKSILDTLSMGVGALAQAVPGLSIAISAAQIAVKVYDIIKANIARAATRLVKQTLKGKLSGGTKGKAFEDPILETKAKRRRELEAKKVQVEKSGQKLEAAEEKELTDLQADETLSNYMEYRFAKELQYVNAKRMYRAGFKIGVEMTKIAGEIATLSGVGAMAGQPLKYFAAGADVGASLWRRIKFFARDKAAESRKTKQTFWNTKVVTGMSTAEKAAMRTAHVEFFFQTVRKVDAMPEVKPEQKKDKQDAMAKVLTYVKGYGITMGELKNTAPAELGKLLYEALGKRE